MASRVPEDAMRPSDEQLERMAAARVAWRFHLLTFVAVIGFLNLVWAFGNGFQPPTLSGAREGAYYWPIWPTLGWGLGLALHWFACGGTARRWHAAEMERLRRELG